MLWTLFAVALALGAPAAADSQPLPQNLFVEAALYSNMVTVYGDDLQDFEIVLKLKNSGGDVLAEMDVFPPYGPDGDQASFFLTDWAEAAPYLGLLPGEWLELEFRHFGEPGPKVSHLLADIEVTSVNVGADTIRGRITPRKSPTAYLNFSGMKFVNGGLPTYFKDEVAVREDGTFSANAGGTADLVRNGRLFVGYEYDVFGIYIDAFVPGLVVLEDTPFAIATGTPLVSYKGRLAKAGGALRGKSTAQPLGWLGVGLFQFHKGRAGAPIRRGDTVRVAGDLPYTVKIPKNFKLTIVDELDASRASGIVFLPAGGSLVLTAPADNNVCLAYLDGQNTVAATADPTFRLSCGTLAQLDASLPDSEIDADGNLVVDLYSHSPFAGWAALAFTGDANGDIFVVHSGLQNPLSYLLTNLNGILSPI